MSAPGPAWCWRSGARRATWAVWLGLGVLHAGAALSQPVADAGAPDAAAPPVELEPLPEAHRPKSTVRLEPKEAVVVGDLLTLTIEASALVGDDVTVADQAFTPFEVLDKRARTEPPADGRQRFVFDVELLALAPGKHAVGPVELRVVTGEGLVGSVRTAQRFVEVKSLLGNEPDAELKPPTEPVSVIQEDKTLLYVLGAIVGALVMALLGWLLSRWWQARERPEPPPPPPRPPWDVAVEKLARLRREKQSMVEAGQGVEFVDQVSDVVREYLGGCHGFDGLESTTDEMLEHLAVRRVGDGLRSEVRAYLGRCDLVKFAKVEPDQDEVDLIFAKAQDLVQFSSPRRAEPGVSDGQAEGAP